MMQNLPCFLTEILNLVALSIFSQLPTNIKFLKANFRLNLCLIIPGQQAYLIWPQD